ncbi:MAG TPA: NAD(P)H-dependent glycerol-3-phosphate dehydrogenase [Bryobacteraceae bacterium]|nr:NAD(P)H-dependent glycerol-3-phosphate dehydrogenase [Bryobacteraceae bacterium]
MKRLAIIGAGSWGTALAIVLAPRFDEIRLRVYEQDLAERLVRTRENDLYLPGFRLPENVAVHTAFDRALEDAEVVLSVSPSHVTRAVFTGMLPHLDSKMLFVSATKGIETKTLRRMSQVIAEVVAPRFAPRVAVLSGPTFAREVAAGEPAAVVISSPDQELNEAIQLAFSGPTFRLYTNTDPVGVELAAALKNVIALGAGVCNGLGLGNNTIAALITRGLAEITRLAVASGGQPRTLAGLAGLGDLVLTCTGALSRNRQVGIELGRGRELAEIVGSMRMVAEGIQTAYAAMDLARKCGIEMPITGQVNAILSGERSPREAIRELMERSLKGE